MSGEPRMIFLQFCPRIKVKGVKRVFVEGNNAISKKCRWDNKSGDLRLIMINTFNTVWLLAKRMKAKRDEQKCNNTSKGLIFDGFRLLVK